MSKYTVSTLDSVGNLNSDDLLLVSTIDENGEYASKNVTFGSIAQQLNSSATGNGNSTGNNTTDLINFFTPRSYFVEKAVSFIHGSATATMLFSDSTIKYAYTSANISCYENESNNFIGEYKKYTPITNIRKIDGRIEKSNDNVSAFISAENIDYYTYNNYNAESVDDNIKNLFVTKTITAASSPNDAEEISVYHSIDGNSTTYTYKFVDISSTSNNKYRLNISDLAVTGTNVRKYLTNGYRYAFATTFNNQTLSSWTLNPITWDSMLQLQKCVKIEQNNGYIQIFPKSSTSTSTVKASAKNSIVYTTEVDITDSCIAYIFASFTCEKTTTKGEAYSIELQIKAPAVSDTWYTVYKQYALTDDSGRTSMNYQLYALAGVKLRGLIRPFGNSGSIYYNESSFNVTLCKTDGPFSLDDVAETLQVLTILYRQSNSNILYITNTPEQNELTGDTHIVGRWISLNGNFSIYGYYRRANIDMTNNMYMLLKKVLFNESESASDGDDSDSGINAGNEETDEGKTVNSYLSSPTHTTPNLLTLAQNSNITIAPHKIPFHTVVLNNKNNNYTSYEYFVPAATTVTQNKNIAKYKYAILLMAANTLGNNSAFKSYGPNTAIINKTSVFSTGIPTISADSDDNHPRSTFIFHPTRRRLTYSFNNNYRRDAAVGLYSIKLTNRTNIADNSIADNLTELELFSEYAKNLYYYDNVFERIAGATQIYYCAVNPVATTISAYTAYQANIVFNDSIESFAVSNKTTGYAKNVAKSLTYVPHIASGVRSFDDYCFYECVNLKQMPDYELSVTSLGNYCFYNCKSLSGELKLNHVTQINGTHIFAECQNLSAIEMSAFSGEIPKNFAYKCNSLKHIDLQSTTSIAEYAFKKTNLEHINNSTAGIANKSNFNKVEKIGKYAFTECASLSDVKLSSCNSIDSYAFYKCSNLTSLDLQDCTNIEIGTNAFYGCPLSGNIYLGNVSIINAGAFSTADKNNTMFILDNVNATELPTLKSTSAFPNNASSYNWKIQVKTEAMKSAMEYDRIWRSFKNRIIVENNNAQSST